MFKIMNTLNFECVNKAIEVVNFRPCFKLLRFFFLFMKRVLLAVLVVNVIRLLLTVLDVNQDIGDLDAGKVI